MADWIDALPEAARSFLHEKRLDEVECVISDLPGIARGKAVPASKFARQQYFHLPDSIFYQTITGEWAEAAGDEGFIEKDMILRPDMSTASAAPWTGDTTIQVIHDAYDRKGNPVPCSPRNVLKRVVQLYKDQGWKPVVAPEIEFYLVAKNDDPDYPLKPPTGRSGRSIQGGQGYSIAGINEFDELIDDIYHFSAAQGLEIDTLIHEEGPAQLEINLRHGDPVELADQVFLFKRTIREAAMGHGIYATFMAKPMQGQAGSAMHIHQSVVDGRTGKNIFSMPDGAPSPEFFHFIGGMQAYVPATLVMMAPYVNSYRRLTPGMAAPVNNAWGNDNRTTAFRVPVSDAAARRVENRLPSSDANPYLALAASLACGLLGIMKGLEPTPPSDGTANEGSVELPRGLLEGVSLLENEPALREVFSDEFIGMYAGVKRGEFETFMQVISPWEREFLLLNV